MPNDPYQIGEDNSGITLVLADRGTSVAVPHKDTHVSGGTDEIRAATISQNGLMTAAHAIKLANIAENADVTSATGIATAMVAAGTATPVDGDSIGFFDVSGPNLFKTVTFTGLATYLGGSFVTKSGAQTVDGDKTFSGITTLATANINGGTITGSTFSLTGNNLTSTLPVNKGGTGLASYTVGSLLYANTSTSFAQLTDVATGNVLLSGGVNTAPSWGKVGLTSHISGTLATGNGGTGSTSDATGTGGVVLNSAPTITSANLVTPDLGVPTAGTLTFCDGLPLSTGTIGTLAVARGGTGFTANPFGQISGLTASGVSFADADYAKRDLDTSLGTPVSDFSTNSVNGCLKYTGSETRNFKIYASTDVFSAVSGATFSIKLYKYTTSTASGALINESQCNANAAGKASSHLAKLVTSWIVPLAQNDWIELHVAAVTNDAGTLQRMRLIATPV